MIPFAQHFPEVAAHETRVITLTEKVGMLPPDGYAFVELYDEGEVRRTALPGQALSQALSAPGHAGWVP